MEYYDFLKSKIAIAKRYGFEVQKSDLPEILLPHQKDIVQWAIQGGRRGIFINFGMGKTVIQLSIAKTIIEKKGGRALIICPLGIKQEFSNDARNLLNFEIEYVRTQSEVEKSTKDILITNYERVVLGNINLESFVYVSLDEGSVLRTSNTNTHHYFLNNLKKVPYCTIATATPSPNDFIELIYYAASLGIMDKGQCKTRFFQRDSTKADELTLLPHKEKEFWTWLSSWGCYAQKPSDLGYADEGYLLPELEIVEHCVKVDHTTVGADKFGQYKMFRDASISLQDAAKEKRDSIGGRVAKMMEIINADKENNYILWHHRESERHEIKKALPEASEIYGNLDIEIREKRIIDFSYGRSKYLATKPSLNGSGCNFQRFCHNAIFLGIDYSFNDFIQAIHRIYRYLQNKKCVIHIIYTESESQILQRLYQKWQQHTKLINNMVELIKQNGMENNKSESDLLRTLGIERFAIKSKHFEIANNDAVEEAKLIESNSIGLIHTSLPFSTQYEYTPSYNDFGHNDDNEAFFEQMDFLTPELYRVLQPGRVAAIHVKDRILFGNFTGYGAPSLYPFSDEVTRHFIKHGFIYFGRITVVTDVVRENNQTYRLGWTENSKDGTKMGVGLPEYVLLFRKIPTNTDNAYADVPVLKQKSEYTRAQWQIDAHGLWRSSGNRLLSSEEIKGLEPDKIQQYMKKRSISTVYDYESHVEVAQELENMGKLPSSYMLVAPESWHHEVWTDIVRIRTLNTTQSSKRLKMHLCLAKGSLILTKEGYKPIENMNVGDMVLTHLGNWKPVIAIKCTGVNPVIQTKAQGVANLITTPTHKLWVRKTNKVRAKDYMFKTEPNWIEAKDTKGGWVNLKLPQIEESELSASDWWIVGRYLADGHFGTRGDVFISVGKNKVQDFELNAFQYLGSKYELSAFQYRLKSLPKHLKEILIKCGKGAANKQVPIEGICLDSVKSESLLSGYLSGDGCVNGTATMASSISRALLLGMAMVAQRARGVIASVYASKKAGKHIIEGREVNQHQLWVMSWRASKRHNFGEILNDGAWKKVDEIVECGESETWSIQVDDDSSYTAEGCVVKNCPLQFDIVDRIIDRYSNKGETVFDPFGGLMTVPYRAVKKGRLGRASELNPGYFRDGAVYMRAVEHEISIPTLFDFEEQLQKVS